MAESKKLKKSSNSILDNFKNKELSLIGTKSKQRQLWAAKNEIKENDTEFMKILFDSLTNKPIYKICDITGMETQYEDPQTGVRFRDSGVYEYTKEVKLQGTMPYINLRKFGESNDPYSRFFE